MEARIKNTFKSKILEKCNWKKSDRELENTLKNPKSSNTASFPILKTIRSKS